MGDIKRKKKKFKRPKQPFDKERISGENVLVEKYGLKNKKEIWKAEAEISKLRRRAKNLIKGSDEQKAGFFEKLNKIGFKIGNISDVLALTKEDWLNRRLQTFVVEKKFANTTKQARQLIVHKGILINEKVVNKPSFVITTDLEDSISLREKKKKVKKVVEKVKEVAEKPAEEVKQEEVEE